MFEGVCVTLDVGVGVRERVGVKVFVGVGVCDDVLVGVEV